MMETTLTDTPPPHGTLPQQRIAFSPSQHWSLTCAGDAGAIDSWRRTAAWIQTAERQHDHDALPPLYEAFLRQEIAIAAQFAHHIADSEPQADSEQPILVLGLANSGLAAGEGFRLGLEQAGHAVLYQPVIADKKRPFLVDDALIEQIRQARKIVIADDTLCYGSTLERVLTGLAPHLPPGQAVDCYSPLYYHIQHSRSPNNPGAKLYQTRVPFNLCTSLVIEWNGLSYTDPLAAISHKEAILLGNGPTAAMLRGEWRNKTYTNPHILALVNEEHRQLGSAVFRNRDGYSPS